MNEQNSLAGAKVKSVTVNTDEDEVVLHLEDGRRAKFSLASECCSWSHFADPHQFDELVGSIIQKVEEREGKVDDSGADSDDYTSWHFLVFETDRGHVTIDWRNDSNGYYDGWLSGPTFE